MKKIGATLRCPLFAGIETDKLHSLLDCLAAVKRVYRKDEFIFMAGDQATSVGIVLSGSVRVLQEDFWGHRGIHGGPSPRVGYTFFYFIHMFRKVLFSQSEKSRTLFVAIHMLYNTINHDTFIVRSKILSVDWHCFTHNDKRSFVGNREAVHFESVPSPLR